MHPGGDRGKEGGSEGGREGAREGGREGGRRRTMNLFKVARNSFFCAIRTVHPEGVVPNIMDYTGMVLRKGFLFQLKVHKKKRLRKL